MSYTGKQLIRAAKKLGYQIKEGGKHTLVFDPQSGRRISTIQRGYIPKGTFNAILKQLGITEAELKKLV
ncbi:MAG: type II toxin-antitoxin system HicA family toxin [Deltaproteobacteria bacterium]|nr:type II toxin-antitoxin system HicA family toxin [Deltaproteobacteria bacterium]